VEQYEEGAGASSVTEQYIGSRQARKRAEDDVKLLQNRIMLLKLEEKKASIITLTFLILRPGKKLRILRKKQEKSCK